MTPQRRMSTTERKQFRDALLAAFDYDSLNNILFFDLNITLQNIVPPTDTETVVSNVVKVAEREGWTWDLLKVARQENPGSPELLAFAQQVGFSPDTPSKDTLESILGITSGMFNFADFQRKLLDIEHRVCRIEIGGNPQGTGFLVAPDIAITNYHVMEPVIQNRFSPDSVVLRFDYKVLADSTEVNPGKEYRLPTGESWLIDHSPFSLADLGRAPNGTLPDPQELDYALLRIDGAPGDEDLLGGERRGWLRPLGMVPDFKENATLFIAQHPAGAPLQLSINTVSGYNTNQTRLTYNNDTEPGSSGSPCFNGDLKLVAIHHGSDPQAFPVFNQGIPFTAIMELLKERNLDQLLMN